MRVVGVSGVEGRRGRGMRREWGSKKTDRKGQFISARLGGNLSH